MKKIFQIVSLFVICNSLFIVSSCHCKRKATSETSTTPEVKRNFEQEGYVKAMVLYSELDACRYLLVLPNEKKLEPSPTLAPEFQKDKLTVWIKYMDKKGGMSVCMAGQMVVISDIQIRK